jgi:hypothetical protein
VKNYFYGAVLIFLSFGVCAQSKPSVGIEYLAINIIKVSLKNDAFDDEEKSNEINLALSALAASRAGFNHFIIIKNAPTDSLKGELKLEPVKPSKVNTIFCINFKDESSKKSNGIIHNSDAIISTLGKKYDIGRDFFPSAKKE